MSSLKNVAGAKKGGLWPVGDPQLTTLVLKHSRPCTLLRWYMASVIIGATSMEQLRECIDAFDVDLDEDTLKAIDEIHMEHRNPMFTD